MVPSKIDDKARYDRVGRVSTLVSDRLLLYKPGGSFVFHPHLPARVQDTMMSKDILKSQGFNIQSMHSVSSFHFIHPFYSDYPIQGHGLLECIPAMIGRETGYTLQPVWKPSRFSIRWLPVTKYYTEGEENSI